jgi:hypothetical protein
MVVVTAAWRRLEVEMAGRFAAEPFHVLLNHFKEHQ